METPRVYLETTIFNFYFAETRGQYYGRTIGYCRDARRFFAAIEAGEFEPYTSVYVIRELRKTRNEVWRDEMLMTAMVNAVEGYDNIGIYEPGEVISEGRP